MEINRDFKIEKVCSTDKTREVLHYVQIQKDDGRQDGFKHVAVACDGCMAVKLPCVADDAEVGKLVHGKAIAEARKKTPKQIGRAHLEVKDDSVRLFDGTSLPNKCDYTYPDLKCVWPDENKNMKLVVGINPKMLLALAEAINAENVTIRFIDEHSPMIVTGGNDGGKGILMPCRIS